MKPCLFFFMLLTAGALGANAQTEQGNFLVGGNLQLITAKTNTDITVNPMVGYFFTDNFAAGANLNVSHSKTGETPTSKNTTFGIGPFVRYYAGSSTVRPFLHGDFDFRSIKTKVGAQTPTTSTGVGYFIAPGAAIFLNQNVALEGLAGYNHFAYKNQDGSGGFAFKLGFQVYLNRAEVKSVTNTVQ